MTISNWIEIIVMAAILIGLGIPLIITGKKVKDLEGADLIEHKDNTQEENHDIYISSR
jgi:hypothetical protein